jgi:hypothetical protein
MEETMKRTRHGEAVADQIQGEDAYGHSGTMNLHDLWNILDQFQTQLMDKDENDPLVFIIGKWMNQCEEIDIDCVRY